MLVIKSTKLREEKVISRERGLLWDRSATLSLEVNTRLAKGGKTSEQRHLKEVVIYSYRLEEIWWRKREEWATREDRSAEGDITTARPFTA